MLGNIFSVSHIVCKDRPSAAVQTGKGCSAGLAHYKFDLFFGVYVILVLKAMQR